MSLGLGGRERRLTVAGCAAPASVYTPSYIAYSGDGGVGENEGGGGGHGVATVTVAVRMGAVGMTAAARVATGTAAAMEVVKGL